MTVIWAALFSDKLILLRVKSSSVRGRSWMGSWLTLATSRACRGRESQEWNGEADGTSRKTWETLFIWDGKTENPVLVVFVVLAVVVIAAAAVVAAAVVVVVVLLLFVVVVVVVLLLLSSSSSASSSSSLSLSLSLLLSLLLSSFWNGTHNFIVHRRNKSSFDGKKPYVLFFVGNGVLLGKDGQLSQHDTPRKCGISHQWKKTAWMHNKCVERNIALISTWVYQFTWQQSPPVLNMWIQFVRRMEASTWRQEFRWTLGSVCSPTGSRYHHGCLGG